MPHIESKRLKPAAATVLVVLLAGLLLAACGGSSKSSSSTAAATSAAASNTPAAAGSRFGALRSCLQKNGITLPNRTPGGSAAPGAGSGVPGTGGAFVPGSGPQLPKGVTRAQLQAAVKKCGGKGFGRFGGPNGRGGRGRFAARYTKFATCMRNNGVNLPAPNTTGNGPIFNTKGIDTTSAAFKTADAKCIKELAPAGAPAAPGSSGAPGAPGAAAGAPPAAQ
jgi:hypothetical protein